LVGEYNNDLSTTLRVHVLGTRI